MPPGLPQVRLLIWSAALIIGPASTCPSTCGLILPARWYPEQLQPAIWGDKLQLLLLAMIPAGSSRRDLGWRVSGSARRPHHVGAADHELGDRRRAAGSARPSCSV